MDNTIERPTKAIWNIADQTSLRTRMVGPPIRFEVDLGLQRSSASPAESRQSISKSEACLSRISDDLSSAVMVHFISKVDDCQPTQSVWNHDIEAMSQR